MGARAASVKCSASATQDPEFQVALGISLAGCAFESYNEPQGAEGYQEFAVNGTETTYVNR